MVLASMLVHDTPCTAEIVIVTTPFNFNFFLETPKSDPLDPRNMKSTCHYNNLRFTANKVEPVHADEENALIASWQVQVGFGGRAAEHSASIISPT